MLSSGVEQSVLSITTLLKAAELTKDLPTDERPGILARPTEVRPLQQDPTNHGARCVLEYKCHNLKVLIHPEQLAVGRWRMGRVSLSLRERRSLEQIVRLQRVEARRYRRARMVLLAASGKSISAIAQQLSTCRLRVSQWLKRFEQARLSGLGDRPRSGRPLEITSLERHQVIAIACRAPKDLGVARNTWTHESLREVLVQKGLVRRISTSGVGRILGEADLKPHPVKGWCHSSDPDFQAKMRAIVALYVRRPAGTPVLSVDEKPGCRRSPERASFSPRRQDMQGAWSSNTGATERAACLPVSM